MERCYRTDDTRSVNEASVSREVEDWEGRACGKDLRPGKCLASGLLASASLLRHRCKSLQFLMVTTETSWLVTVVLPWFRW